jgi:hypothetical protein
MHQVWGIPVFNHEYGNGQCRYSNDNKNAEPAYESKIGAGTQRTVK